MKSSNLSKFSQSPSNIGNTEPICPYCKLELEKMPGRKKKCPGCEQYMLVRTRPSDRMKILIREDEAVLVEEQCAIANGTHAQFLEARKRHENERNRLRMEFGREPSENEINWALLESELPQYAEELLWGLYRNARFSMGDILRKEGRYLEALDIYLEVCYFDLNGPNNCGFHDPELLRKFPPFNPKDAFLAPGMLGRIEDMLGRQGISRDNINARFIEIASKVQQALALPVPPEIAWNKLEKEIVFTES